MALDLASRKKTSFSSGTFLAGQALVAYDLQAVSHYLRTISITSHDLAGLAPRSQRRYSFPALAVGAPLLIDSSLKLPLSLAAALQTAAMYQGLGWNEPSTRRHSAAEFFRHYTVLLLKESVELLVKRQVGLELATANLVIEISRGTPTGIQVRHLAAVVGPEWSSLTQETNFKSIPVADRLECGQRFITELLTQNLRPLVAKLVEISQVKPQVLWDYAIEALLAVLDSSAADETMRQVLLEAELNPGDRLLTPTRFTSGNLPTSSESLYLKQSCCEKFKRGNRCFNCPAQRRNRPGLPV